MQHKHIWWLASLVIIFILFSGSFFVVDQTEYALVLRFGEVTRQITKPGLNFKMPLIEDVAYLDNRIHNLDPPPAPLTLADKKRLEIDAFVRWRITDPLTFYKAMHTEQQLGNLINGALLDVLGKVPLADLLTEQRDSIMQSVRAQVNAEMESEHLGMSIVDVRIGRADLPRETLDAVFQRMASERKREASEYRAEGEQKSQEIKSTADAERIKIVSQAEKEAQDTRGAGDEKAIEIYAALEAYRTGLNAGSTTYILSPNSDFFRYFKDPGKSK
jgi:membrane protease subunit HflC